MMLEARKVAYAYDRGVERSHEPAVRDVSVVLGIGEVIALTGPNGSGKSTLLKLLARVLTQQQGEIVLDGKRLRDWSPREYARHVAYLPQDPEPVFPMTARDVVVSGRAPFLGRFEWEGAEDFAEAERALELCDATYLSGRFLDEMSGGERKRVFLARVLVARPQLILLDEPLASLDVEHVQQFSALLRQIVQRTGATVLYATHDLNWAAAYCDRMLVMQHGSLAMDGPPSTVMTEDVVKRLFGFVARSIEADGQRWLIPRR